MRVVCIAGLLLVMTLSPGPCGPLAASTPIVAGGNAPAVLSLPVRVASAAFSWESEVTALNLINQERRAAGLPALMPHAGIRTAARMHGKELFAKGWLSHRSLDGRWPAARIKALGIKVTLVGENLAYAGTVRDAHRTLMASAAHRKNMLSPWYRRAGIAVVDGGAFGVIVVQDFTD